MAFSIPLPKSWTGKVKSAMTHVVSLAQFAMTATRGWAGGTSNPNVRRAAEVEQLKQQIALLREEGDIKDARMERIAPAQRPQYSPTERLRILQLRAARCWSLSQTARVFQVTSATISSWIKSLDEGGPDALLQTREPVNCYPDFVRQSVQSLQALCPHLGKVKIAQILTRAGLHLAASTGGRIRLENPVPPKPSSTTETQSAKPAKRINAKHVNHVWHTDLTTVQTSLGAWVPWLPQALSQRYPFCWWVANVMDHRSRRVLGIRTFNSQPSSQQMRHFLGQVIVEVGATPKHLITDRGKQFDCPAFKHWCLVRGIRQRFGAVGEHGSIAVIERFHRTFKELVRRLLVIPMNRAAFQRECNLVVSWYNADRAHTTLHGATPDEIFFGVKPANRNPRFEPRPDWPRRAPCAAPQTLVKGQPGAAIEVKVEFVHGRRHLPRVTVSRAA